MFSKSEIKYKIDEAIQFAMYYTEKEHLDTLMEARGRLYEQFGIED